RSLDRSFFFLFFGRFFLCFFFLGFLSRSFGLLGVFFLFLVLTCRSSGGRRIGCRRRRGSWIVVVVTTCGQQSRQGWCSKSESCASLQECPPADCAGVHVPDQSVECSLVSHEWVPPPES